MSEPRQPVIVGGARTPVGRLLGALASKSASDLGGVAIAGALDRAGIGPDAVEYVIMGQVLAAALIRLGEHDVIVAGGMESMTQAPHLAPKSRFGYKYGPVRLEDSMALDGLTDAFDHLSMGESTEKHNRRLGITL